MKHEIDSVKADINACIITNPREVVKRWERAYEEYKADILDQLRLLKEEIDALRDKLSEIADPR